MYMLFIFVYVIRYVFLKILKMYDLKKLVCICVINLVVKLIMDNWNCVLDGDDIFMRYINRSCLKLWMYGKI